MADGIPEVDLPFPVGLVQADSFFGIAAPCAGSYRASLQLYEDNILYCALRTPLVGQIQ